MSDIENKKEESDNNIDDINSDLDEEIKSKIIVNKNNVENINVFYDFYNFISKLFNFINHNIFENYLGKVALTFVDYGATKKDSTITLGRFDPKGWNFKNNMIPSIMITNEWLLNEWRGYHDLVATLIHEMVHFECSLKSLKDTKNKNYHTVIFKNVGIVRGLVFDDTPDKKYGFSYCKLNDKTKKLVDDFMIENNFTFQTPFHKTKKENDSSKKSLKKYFKFTCPSCNTNIQSELKVKTICGRCGEDFLFNDRRYIESKVETIEEAKELLDFIESELQEFS